MSSRRFWVRLVLGALALALLAQIVHALVADPPTGARESERRRAKRDARPAAAVDEHERAAGNGNIEPKGGEIRLAAATSGVVRSILVREGSWVEAGALLVELENSEESAALTAAEADANARRWELVRLRHGNRQEDVAAAAAEYQQALARAELSSDLAAREKILLERGSSTETEQSRTRRQAEIDTAAKERAEVLYRAVRAGSRREDVERAQAEFDAAEARRERARASLEQTRIRAPSAGEVLKIRFRVGEYYAPAAGGPLLYLGDTKTLQVRVEVHERDAGRVVVGARASVEAPAYRGSSFAGQVTSIGRRMDRQTAQSDDPLERNDARVEEVIVTLDATDKLLVGQRVLVYMDVATPGGKTANAEAPAAAASVARGRSTE